MEEKTICSVCGAILTDETAMKFDGKIFCDECLRRKTIACDCCGKLIYRDEIHGDEVTILRRMLCKASGICNKIIQLQARADIFRLG